MRLELFVVIAGLLAGVAAEEDIKVTDPTDQDLSKTKDPADPKLRSAGDLSAEEEKMVEDLMRSTAADGSDRVDQESVVTTGASNIDDLLKDAGFAPAPPWQSGKRAVRKAARCRACEFVVGMLDEKILNALAEREKEMPLEDAVIAPVTEAEFHAMLASVCADAGMYVDTLWDAGARTSTGRRDLEFLAAGTRVKQGQALEEKMKGHYETACADVARIYKDELTESVRLWNRDPDVNLFLKTREVLFETEDSAKMRGAACETTLELCPEGSILVKRDARGNPKGGHPKGDL